MTRTRNFIVAALCGVALGALPLDLPDGFSGDGSAWAKGNGGGNGGGNAGGGGKSAGKSSSSTASKSKSAKTSTTKTASTAKTNKGAAKSAAKQQVAAVAKEKNIHAQLGALNSLNRNINAYPNAKSPRFAAVQSFVVASAQYEIALDKVEAANTAAAAEQEKLDALNAELGTLSAMTEEAVAGLTAEEQAERTSRMSALEAEIGEQAAAVETASQAATEAQAAAETAAVGTDEASLQAALEAMSNKTVNEAVVSWSKEVLGVGTAVGKIDEMKSVLEAQAVDPQETAAVDTEETPETDTDLDAGELEEAPEPAL